MSLWRWMLKKSSVTADALYLEKKTWYARSINDPSCPMCREKLLVFQHWITSGLKHVSIISLVICVTSVRALPISCNTCARWVLLGFAERYNVPDSFPFSSSIEYSKQPIWSSIIGFGAYVLPYLTTSIPSATLVSDGFRASFVFRPYILDAAWKAYRVLMKGTCRYIAYNSIS